MGKNEIPLPDVTYQYTSTPFIEGIYDNAVANEMGVTMTGSVTTYISDGIRTADPYTEDGASEMWISGYIAAVSATAREAVENYGKIMETYGSSESNTFMIADQTEAWYLESYSGHQWVAVKMPTASPCSATSVCSAPWLIMSRAKPCSTPRDCSPCLRKPA